MPVYDIADRFDRIGASIERRLMKPGTWEPQGGEPVPVMVGFQAPKLYFDAQGVPVQTVQPMASGRASILGMARQGDVLVIGGHRWVLRSDPEPYGSGDLVRMPLDGPYAPRP